MSVKIRPLGDRVIIEPNDEEEMTFAGGQLSCQTLPKRSPSRALWLPLDRM